MRTDRLFALAGIVAVAVSMSGCGRSGGAAGSSNGGAASGSNGGAAVSSGAAASGSNALIGQWSLSQQVVDPNHEGFTCTRTALKFAPDAWGYVRDGKFSQFPVSGYDVTDGANVMVHTLPSDEAFTVVDNNTIEGIEFTTKCVYTRSG